MTFDPARAVPEDEEFNPERAQPDVGPPTRAVLKTAVPFKPDDVAEAARLAARYPAPVDTLYRNLADVRLQAAVDAADERLKTSPKLAEHMRTQPFVAKLAHDDVDRLADLEQFVRDVGGAAKAGVFRASRGAAGTFQAGLELVAPVLDPLEPVTAIGGNPLRRLAEGFAMMGEAAGETAKAARPKSEGILMGGFFSGIESLTQNVMTLPMAFLNPAAALTSMTAFTGGDAYQDAREKGLPMSQALPFAASQAAIEYATEKLPLGALLKDVKAGAGFLTVLGRQIALEVPGEQIATILQDLNEWAILNPEKPFSSYLEERPSAAAQTLVATIVGTGGNVAIAKGIEAVVERATRDGVNMQRAGVMGQALEQAMKGAQASALRERSPEVFRQLMTDMSEDGSLYIDAEVLNQMPADVLQQMEGVAQQLETAAPDTPVAVKVADALTLLPGTPAAEVFMQNARSAPDAPSLLEAETAGKKAAEFLQNEMARVVQEAQDQEAMRASSEAVRQTIAAELSATGRYRPAVSDQMATWATAFYTTMASRVGMTPEQFFQRYRIRVLGAPSQQGDAYNASQPGRLDGVEAYHWSMEARPVLSSAFYGTGLKGSAREEIMSYPDQRIRQRLSFYVDKGTGVRPEAGVGGVAHRVRLDNIYDANADPLRLRGGNAREFESKVLDAGFDGYLDRLDGEQPGQVIMLGQRTLQPEVLGPLSRVDAGQKVPALERREAPWTVQASGAPEMLQMRLARMQSNPSWADRFDMKIEGNELLVREKGGVFEQRAERPVAPRVAQVADISNARAIAGTRKWPTNRDFKLALQAAVRAVTGSRDLTKDTPENRAYLVRQLLKEAREALVTNANAVGWYDEKVTTALEVVSAIHPELKTDEQARFAFIWALAVTSNGVKVNKNFELAERAYTYWKANGVMPTANIGVGTAASKIHEGLATYNDLIKRWGYERFKTFATTLQPNRQVKATYGRAVSGEGMDTQVYGAGIVGPKIGNGFFMNLYGEFGQLTMDRWWVRMWGRLTGDLVLVDRQAIAESRAAFVSIIDMIKADKTATKVVEQAIKTRLGKGDPIAMAKAIMKATTKKEVRDTLATVLPATPEREAAVAGVRKVKDFVSIGDELRKAAKSYYGALDGQIEVPGGSKRRDMMRAVSQAVLAELQKEQPTLTMADFQALMWYPEKTLYDSAGAQSEESEEGYEDDEAPDYANAAIALAREQGVSDEDINAAVERARSDIQARQRAGRGGRGAGDVPAQSGAGTGDAAQGVDEGGGQVNIGLADPQGGPNLDPEVVLQALAIVGADVQDSTVQVSDTEPTLVAKLKKALTPEQGNFLSRVLDQEAVAQQRRNKAGDLFGPMADKWGPFNPQFFVTMTGERGVDVLWQNTAGPRGTFNPKTLELVLNENADLSTWFHETGHFFLEVLADIASQPGAPAQIVEDYNKVLGWFGVTAEQWASFSLDQKRPYHERWAESVEQYVMEGKAPSTELAPLMRRFATWLKSVYSSIKQFLAQRGATDDPAQLNDDIRRVMDRMLATDEQIAQAEEIAGMVPDEEATNAAADRLRKRSMADLKFAVKARDQALKELRKQAAAIEKKIHAEVTAEVNARPEVLAKAALEKAEKEYESDPVAADFNAATIADAFGFPSVDAMYRAIDLFGDKQAAIDGMTEQRMLEEHGDLVDERAISEAANEAVHNAVRQRVLASELRTQAELMSERRDTGETNSRGAKITVNALVEAAKQFGAKVAGRTVVRDLKATTWKHTAAERRAGRRYTEMTAAGKTLEAVEAKRDQVLQNAAAKAVLEAQAEARKIVEFFRKVAKGNDEKTVEKGRDPDIVNAARAVLAAYGFETPTTKAAGDYLETLQRNDPDTYAAIQPMMAVAMQNAQPLESLTFEELQGLHEQVEAMWHLAKRSRQMEVDGDLLDIDEVADEVYAKLEEIGIPDTLPGETGALTRREILARQWLQQGPALLRRVEQWAEAKDGKFGGPFLRFIFQPVKDAADRYRTDRLAYRKKFQALVDNIAPTFTNKTIEAPELNYTFGKGHNGIGHAELLHALLHTGNESNKRKLLLGRGWAAENADGTLDTSRWDTFLKRMHDTGVLEKAHWDFVQGVWDLMEETKPLAQKTHRDVFGRYFAEITAEPVETPFGTYRGGYVPAQADPLLVQDADLRELLETENAGMAQAFPQTNRGFTKSRVEYNRPLKLDLRTLPQHIDKVLLFSHMEPAVRGVARLLRRPKVSQPLGRVDPAAMGGLLKPWLNRAARQTVETPMSADAGLNRLASTVRGRVGMALMFANVSNTLQQITGFFTASLKVKPSLMRRATAQFIRNPAKFKESVWQMSPYMADRASNEVAVLSDTLEAILINPTTYQRAEQFTRRHAYFLQTAFDNAMSPIIWSAAYNQGLAEGMDERMAIRFADGTIRQTQGSTLPEDVSRIETGPAYARLFTQFVGYFNMMANTNATAVQQIFRELGLKKGAGKAAMALLVGLAIPIWIAEAIALGMRGGPDDEDDDGYLDDWLASVFGFGTIKGMLSGVPFLGAVGQSVVNRFNDQPADDKFSLSPTVSVLESAAGAPASVYKAIVDDASAQKAVRDTAALITVMTGLPAMAAARPIGYAAGIADDRIEPTGPVDAARGLITGTASPESKQ